MRPTEIISLSLRKLSPVHYVLVELLEGFEIRRKNVDFSDRERFPSESLAGRSRLVFPHVLIVRWKTKCFLKVLV